jgi:hypothetical protein
MYFSNKNCEHDYLSYASQAGGPAAAGAAARSSVARTGTRSPVRDLRRVRRPDTSAGLNLLFPRGAGDKPGNLPHGLVPRQPHTPYTTLRYYHTKTDNISRHEAGLVPVRHDGGEMPIQ